MMIILHSIPPADAESFLGLPKRQRSYQVDSAVTKVVALHHVLDEKAVVLVVIYLNDHVSSCIVMLLRVPFSKVVSVHACFQ